LVEIRLTPGRMTWSQAKEMAADGWALGCHTSGHYRLQTLSGDDSLEVVRQAGALSAHCRYARIDEILQQGLEPWLQAAMARLDRLGNAIHRQFMVSTDVATPVMAARPWSHEQ